MPKAPDIENLPGLLALRDDELYPLEYELELYVLLLLLWLWVLPNHEHPDNVTDATATIKIRKTLLLNLRPFLSLLYVSQYRAIFVPSFKFTVKYKKI